MTDASTADDDEHKYLPDKWVLNKDVLMRIHTTPRRTLFTPNEDKNDPCPLPLAYLDIMRRSDTSQSSKAESVVEDYWTDPQMSKRELTDEWFGRTMFYLLKPHAGPNHYWVDGRLTRRQKTTRPDNIWTDTW